MTKVMDWLNANKLSLNISKTKYILVCTEDDNSCYRNVCKMSVVSFALAVVFKIYFDHK